MLSSGRIPQTILLHGPEGVGKATLVRRFAARLLRERAELIEADDLSLAANLSLIAEREKWTSEKRSDDPLFFSSHPDFVTFCPEGPLRQLSIQQMRLLRERAQLLPLKGRWRVFLIDRIDRSSQQAADSLLKTLEEPPPHLVLFLTAENPYDIPPTIRSRSVQVSFSLLDEADLRSFLEGGKGVQDAERRLALCGGSPGVALTLDLALYEKRRGLMLALLESAAGGSPFHAWTKASESFLASKSEKLDFYFKPLYSLLEDILLLSNGSTRLRNRDLEPRLRALANRVRFDWIQECVALTDQLVSLQRRNIQKGPALDSLILRLRH
jgi:DNA polymerase-3 subunit delta'